MNLPYLSYKILNKFTWKFPKLFAIKKILIEIYNYKIKEFDEKSKATLEMLSKRNMPDMTFSKDSKEGYYPVSFSYFEGVNSWEIKVLEYQEIPYKVDEEFTTYRVDTTVEPAEILFECTTKQLYKLITTKSFSSVEVANRFKIKNISNNEEL